ncbi:MAG: pyridoxal phosphate-dependent aminotransferase [Kiritimatiellae bacterium]|nr:pyridoxal phosphate-dependent aminotransferase [Kiritimatiellia bacterium]
MNELVTKEIDGYLANSSMIRKMFEAGIELRKKYGAENVYDFSLGNPDVPPPSAVKAALKEIAEHADEPFAIGYMPNAGYPATREALAKKVSEEQATQVPAANIVVTCGAAGAINVLFRAVLSDGDEVICPSPYFVEYGFYAGNFGGKLVPVPTKLPDFTLDIAAIDAAITPKTRAVIVNSPNNPTGQIYSREELAALAEVLKKHSEKNGRAIYLVSDEPYRALNFDGAEIPSVFSVYPAAVVIGSFSKTLSLAGERIGYVAVNPALEGAEKLMAALILTNRILGFVNAPAIAQKVLQTALDSQVDIDIYRKRRALMADVLTNAGVEFMMPKGAFYFFAKSPVEDERIFVEALLNEHVLAVPGRGFGLPGYIRLAFCVEDSTIINSRDAFKRAVDSLAK